MEHQIPLPTSHSQTDSNYTHFENMTQNTSYLNLRTLKEIRYQNIKKIYETTIIKGYSPFR